MIKKLGELKVNKSDDYNDEIITALKKAGFVIVLDCETLLEEYYIIAKEKGKNEE